MTQQTALFIFRLIWSLMLLVTLLYQALFEDWPRQHAGILANFIVVVPYLLVFGLYYLQGYVGSYNGNNLWRTGGAAVLAAGLCLYLAAHLSLRSNWSIMASVKQGNRLIHSGVYRYVRHPMYASMFLIVPGSGLLISNYLMLICLPLLAVIYYFRARQEEKLLSMHLSGYAAYMLKTRMFIPGVF
jgi:protein-S-isoprenylcysteine O-methyltransferase Ste14